jgi:two-component system, NtrC family, sensor kinase
MFSGVESPLKTGKFLLGFLVGARSQVISLLGPALASLLVMGAVSLVGLNGLDRVTRQAQVIVDRNLENSVRISDFDARTRALNEEFYRLLSRRAANIGGGDEVQSEIDRIVREAEKLIADLEDYKNTRAPETSIPAISNGIKQLQEYQQALEFVGSMLEVDFASAVNFIQPFNGLFDNLSLLLRGMKDMTVVDARRLTAEASAQTGETTKFFLYASVLVAVGISGITWGFGRRQQRVLAQQVAERTADLRRTTDELQSSKEEAEGALGQVQRAQKQLVESEKMAALGSLVAGVAHEINTPVGTALTASSLLDQRTREFGDLVAAGQIRKADLTRFMESVRETAGLVLSNINRAAELIQSFKQVAVDQTSDSRRVFNLQIYLNEIVTSLSPNLRKAAARVEVICDPAIEMNSYPGALAQVITNLIMNAVKHAFEHRQGGLISIRVERGGVGKIKLIFKDNGKGMPTEVLVRIFDPFFTTKRGAGGTGLGMHIVYNLVTQQLGGSIVAQSVFGEGTTFLLEMEASHIES